MRWVAVALLAAALACGRSSESKPPPAAEPPAAPLPAAAPALSALEPWMETTLACAVKSTIEHMDASQAAYEVAAAALSTDRARAHRHLRHWIAAFTAAATAPRSTASRVSAEDLFDLAAKAHAEVGDLRTARELADRAVAAGRADPTRPPAAVVRGLEVLAWTGDGARAAALAEDRMFDRVLVANGLTRAGDADGARRLLLPILAEAATADRSIRGLIVMAHVQAGELAAARALISAAQDPDERALLYAWAADAMRHTTHAGRAELLDDAIAVVSADARATRIAGTSILHIAWIDLVKARDLLDPDRTARLALHQWLLDPARVAAFPDLVAINVVRAEVFGMPAEADRLLAALPPEHRTRAALDLDLVRGHFDRAFALLAPHFRERAALRAHDPGYDSAIDAGIDAVEGDLWLAFTDAPRDPALIAAFQQLVCR